MHFLFFEEWLLKESKSEDGFVGGMVNSKTNSSSGKTLNKGDVIKINALQYSKGGDSDVIDIIFSNGKFDKLQKKFIDIKF